MSTQPSPPYGTGPTSPGNDRLFSQFLRTYRTYPLLFLILQVPKAAFDVLDKIFMPSNPTHLSQIITMIVYLAVMIVVAQTTVAFIYLLVENLTEGKSLSLGNALHRLTDSLPTLLPAVLLLAALVMVGFTALVIPALYFTTVYLYVPLLAVVYRGKSVASIFYLSNRLAKRHLPVTLVFVTIDLIVSCALYFQADVMKIGYHLFGAVPPADVAWGIPLQVGLSILFGSLLDVALAQCFYQIKVKENLNA